MFNKHLFFAIGIAVTLGACGDNKVAGQTEKKLEQSNSDMVIHSEAELTKEGVRKLYSEFTPISGQLDIKGVKIGMPFGEFIKVLGLVPSPDSYGGPEHAAMLKKYDPATDKGYMFPEAMIINPSSRPGDPRLQMLDLSKIPQNENIFMQGRLDILNASEEFVAIFLDGKLAFLQAQKVGQNAAYENSDTHVLVDSFAQKFGVKPKVFKYQGAGTYAKCQELARSAVNQTKNESEPKRRSECDNYKFIAGFQDSYNGELLLEGKIRDGLSGNVAHSVDILNLQTKDWMSKRAEIEGNLEAKKQSQQQEFIKKRNSDL